jgi:chromosome segregation ATPase
MSSLPHSQQGGGALDLVVSPASFAALSALITSESRLLELQSAQASDAAQLASTRTCLRESERARADLQAQLCHDADARQRRLEEAERRADELERAMTEVLRRSQQASTDREHLRTQLRHWDSATRAVVARIDDMQTEAQQKDATYATELEGVRKLAAFNTDVLTATIKDFDADGAAARAVADDLVAKGAALNATIKALGERIVAADGAVAVLTADSEKQCARVVQLQRKLEAAGADHAAQLERLEQAKLELADKELALRSEISKREYLETQESKVVSSQDAHLATERANAARLRAELEAAQRALSELTERASSEREASAAHASQRKRAEDDFATASKQLQECEAALAEARAAQLTLNEAHRDVEQRERTARADLQKLGEELEAARATLARRTRARDDLFAAKVEVDKELCEVKHTLVCASAERDAARNEVAALTSERADLQSKAAQLPTIEGKLLDALEAALATESGARLDRQRREELAAELEDQHSVIAAAQRSCSALQIELATVRAAAAAQARDLDLAHLGAKTAAEAAEAANAQRAADALAHKDAEKRGAESLEQLRTQLDESIRAREAAARKLSECQNARDGELEALRGQKTALIEQAEAARVAIKKNVHSEAALKAELDTERKTAADQKRTTDQRIGELEANVFTLQGALSTKERELRDSQKARTALGEGGLTSPSAVATPVRSADPPPASGARGSEAFNDFNQTPLPRASVALTEPATTPSAVGSLWFALAQASRGDAGDAQPASPTPTEPPAVVARAPARAPAGRKGREAAKGNGKARKNDKAVPAAATSAAAEDAALASHVSDPNSGIIDIFEFYPS